MDSHFEPQETPKTSGWRRALLTAALLLACGFIAVVAGFSVAFHRTPLQLLSGELTPSPQELFGKSHIVVLVEGLDYDYNSKDEEYSTQSRSDVIKAVDLDFRTGNVYVLSVPRDMEAVLPNGEDTKINQAQSEGGVREAQAVIARWLGIPSFDRYVVLRINTTKDLINAIGGIDIDPMNSAALTHTGPNGPIDYDDTWGHLHIHFKPGMQHLNGDQAVAYARFRHDWCSDPCRIMRQDQVMQAALSKLRSQKFNTLMHLNDLLGVFARDVQTNFNRQEELSLATLFAKMPKDGLHTAKIDYVDTKIVADGGEVLVPNEAQKEHLVENMLVDPPVPTPSPDAAAIAAINPVNVRVDVENGSGIPGAARRVAALLKQQGFAIGAVGNARTADVTTTEVREHSRITFAGIRVRQALGKGGARAQVVAVDDTSVPAAGAAASDVTVIVGQDLAAALMQQASTQP